MKSTCRYCRTKIHTIKAKEIDENNKPHVYDEWVHVEGDNLFCPPNINERPHTARPNDNLTVEEISRLYPGAEIVTYVAGDWMPFVCFVHDHELDGDRLRLVTHTYKGWDKNHLSLEITSYAY